MTENKLRQELGDETLWGLPKSISDELVDTYPLKGMRKLSLSLYFIVLAFFGALFGLTLTIICFRIAKRNAAELAVGIDGFAYDVNFSNSLSIGSFAWPFLAAVIVAYIYIFVPMPKKGALFLGPNKDVKDDPRKAKKLKILLEKRGNTAKASDLINDYAKRNMRIAGLIAMPIILLSVFKTYVDLNRLTIISPTGIHISTFVSRDMEVKRWDEAVSVSLACRYVPRKKSGKYSQPEDHSLHYIIQWEDGTKFRLPQKYQLNGKKWLDNFESVDTVLVSANINFRRLSAEISDPLHPKCLKNYRDRLGPDLSQRFDRLLRIGELD